MAEVLGSPFQWTTPPAWGPHRGGQHWDDDEADHWSGEVPGEESPAYDALDDSYKALLAKIVALPGEAERQEAIDHFKGHQNPEVGKAMLAAFTETMATRQAAARPVLRHPAADPAGDMETLRNEKNKAEQLA